MHAHFLSQFGCSAYKYPFPAWKSLFEKQKCQPEQNRHSSNDSGDVVALGDVGWCGPGRAGVKAALNNQKGLCQPKKFHDSTIVGTHKDG